MPHTRKLTATILLTFACFAPADGGSAQILPRPRSVSTGEGGFEISGASSMSASDAGERNAAKRFADLLAKVGGPTLSLRPGGTIRFVREAGLPPEGYRLTTTKNGAIVTASDDAGLFYGGVSLWQLATARNGRWSVPVVAVEDAPRFRWRGLMLDSARHYQSPAFVRRFIDAMAANKLNTLHWHLVDDQGWRIEIKRYPKLTGVSAWRRPATSPGAPALPRTGGFYTQADIRQIVAYAASRAITIVPEIEMPGHALAAIRAHPELGTGKSWPAGTESDWGVFPWLYNTDENTFRFLKHVLDEVIDLFPSRYVHVGGDEAVKDQWRASPTIQRQMRTLGITSEDALQGWFMNRIGRHLAARGRKMIGWDEILDGGAAPDATVMSWRGIEGAVTAAKSGHDAILTPAPGLYLDNRQGLTGAEGTGRGHLVTLADVYDFNPAPSSIPEQQQRHILGLQGNVWTEHLRSEELVAAAAFPRAIAIAEVGWSEPADRHYEDFLQRLVPQMTRLSSLGISPSVAAFRPWAMLAPHHGQARVVLDVQAGLTLRYTVDGTAPSAQSPAYRNPLSLPVGTRLRASSELGGSTLPGGLDLELTSTLLRRRDDTQLELCTRSIPLRLADDAPAEEPRTAFLLDIGNPCWIYKAAPMDGVNRIEIAVGQVPFNYQIGKDIEKIRFRPPASAAGEFEVRDGCAGRVVAVLPLKAASLNPGVTTLSAETATLTGAHDLCITYTATGVEPLWAVSYVQLVTSP